MKAQREKIVFIINPKSGTKPKQNLQSQIKRNLDTDRFSPIFEYTEYANHATEITREYLSKKVKKIVAVGGDGTVNQVAQALINTDATLGIIPMGSGNGFAHHLNLPMTTGRAVRVINRDKIKLVDVAFTNNQSFLCTSGLGFDAYVSHLFSGSKHRGMIAYVATSIKAFRMYKHRRFTARIDDENVEKELFLITIANAMQYGNNGFIAPNADISDGLLDVTTIHPFPWYLAPSITLRLFTRRIAGSKYVETFRTSDLTVHFRGENHLHFDGEPTRVEGPVRFTITPLALKVLIP